MPWNQWQLSRGMGGRLRLESVATLVWNTQIAGLSFPLGAIAASHLRSLQASTQIKQQREQNIFTNHFKHLEEFDNAIGIADVREKFRVKAPTNQIHAIIFPNSTDGDYSVSDNVVSNVKNSIELITEFLTIAKKAPLTHRVIEELSENLKASTKEIIGEHSINLPIVDLNKYDYSKTLCLRYLNLHRKICEFASFYSRNSIIEINENNKKLSNSVSNTLDRFIDQEKAVLTRISSSIQELRSAKSRNVLNYAIVSKCHHAIVQEIEERNLDISYYYPYEEITKYGPSVKSEIISFIEETAPEDTKSLIKQSFHPQ
ncbi:hypothetical protein [Marinobacter sp. MIT932201]|uniref:hypothetical protein n=1 Tax=Marinobacter sp. MIT932201 TaxID=3096995 RepID=UPI00399B7795